MRALAICDGEHYPSVVRDALGALPYEVVGLWLAGGSEKLRGGEDYGVPVVDSLEVPRRGRLQKPEAGLESRRCARPGHDPRFERRR